MINNSISSSQFSISKNQSVKQAYLNYLNREIGTSIYNEFKNILYSKEDSLTQYVNQNYLYNLLKSRSGVLKICDIGGGDGRRVLDIMAFCYEKFGIKFELDFIEQSSIFVRQFKQSLSQRKTDFIEKVNIFNNLFETVDLPSNYYDIVLLIHSIFCLEKDQALEKILSLRNHECKIIIISNAGNSFLGGLKQIIDDNYQDSRYEIEDLAQELNSKKINYQLSSFDTKWLLNSSSLKTSPELQVILEWISLGNYQKYDLNKQAKIQQYINSQSIQLEDKILLTEKETILQICSPNGVL